MIPVFRPAVGDDEWAAIKNCFDTGWIGLGPKTAAFEKAFGEFIGAEYVSGMNSCTAALDMAFKVLNITEGEVITTSLTFVSSNHAILYNNCTPVFADVLPGDLAAVEIGHSWRHLETLGVLGAWASVGLVLAPIVLRRMARRESGSAVDARRQRALQRVR